VTYPNGALLFGYIAPPDVSAIAARLRRNDRRECRCKEVFHGAKSRCRIEVLDCNGILHNGLKSEERPLLPDAKRYTGSISESPWDGFGQEGASTHTASTAAARSIAAGRAKRLLRIFTDSENERRGSP